MEDDLKIGSLIKKSSLAYDRYSLSWGYNQQQVSSSETPNLLFCSDHHLSDDEGKVIGCDQFDSSSRPSHAAVQEAKTVISLTGRLIAEDILLYSTHRPGYRPYSPGAIIEHIRNRRLAALTRPVSFYRRQLRSDVEHVSWMPTLAAIDFWPPATRARFIRDHQLSLPDSFAKTVTQLVTPLTQNLSPGDIKAKAQFLLSTHNETVDGQELSSQDINRANLVLEQIATHHRYLRNQMLEGVLMTLTDAPTLLVPESGILNQWGSIETSPISPDLIQADPDSVSQIGDLIKKIVLSTLATETSITVENFEYKLTKPVHERGARLAALRLLSPEMYQEAPIFKEVTQELRQKLIQRLDSITEGAFPYVDAHNPVTKLTYNAARIVGLRKAYINITGKGSLIDPFPGIIRFSNGKPSKDTRFVSLGDPFWDLVREELEILSTIEKILGSFKDPGA